MKTKNITKSLLLTLSAFALLFSACDKVEDATTARVKVNDINIDFDASVEAAQSASPASFTVSQDAGTGMNKFSGSIVLNKDDEAFEDIKTYLNQIDEIEIGNLMLQIKDKAAEVQTYSAENIVIKAVGTNYSNTVTIESYKFGQSYTNDAKLIAFALNALKQVKNGNILTLSIEGATDALEEDMLEVDLTIQGIVLLIKTL